MIQRQTRRLIGRKENEEYYNDADGGDDDDNNNKNGIAEKKCLVKGDKIIARKRDYDH